MKLKFINLLLASTLLVGSAQVFTSCKDNESDLINELSKEDRTLRAELESEITRAKKIDGQLQDSLKTLYGRVTQKEDSLKKAYDNAKKNGEDIDKLIGALGEGKTIEDLANQIGQISTIESQISSINTTLYGNPDGTGTTGGVLGALQGDINGINDNLKNLADSVYLIKELQSTLASVQNQTNANASLLTTVESNAAEALRKANENAGLITGLNETLTTVKDMFGDYYTKDDVDALLVPINEKLNNIAEIYATKEWVSGTYATKEALRDSIVSVSKAIVDSCASVLAQANAYTDIKFRELTDSLDNLKGQVTTNTADIADLLSRIQPLEGLVQRVEELEKLNAEVAKLNTRIEEVASRLTNIVVHQAVSPAFGSFNLPVGVSNKLLVAYAGENAGGLHSFPAVDGETTLNGAGIVPAGIIKESDRVTLAANDWLMAGAKDGKGGELGVVYMTLNPNNVAYKNFDFSLVNSKGTATKVNLDVQPSDVELRLGYGRSEANGFYAANVTVDEANVGDVQFTLSQSFKSQVEQALESPREAIKNKSLIAGLSKSLISEINGALPALAVSGSWKEGDNLLSVNSEYNIGAATVKPLSFQFFSTLEDKGSLGQIANLFDRIPDLSKIPEKFETIFDELTGNIKINVVPSHSFEVDYNGIKVKVDTINVDIPQLSEDENPVVVVVPKIWVDDEEYIGDTIRVTVDVAEMVNPMLKDIRDGIQNQVNTVLNNLDKELINLDTQLSDMVASMEKQVNEMFEEMNTQVNTQVSDIIADMKNQLMNQISGYTDRLLPLTNRMESIISRMQNVLNHPFYYVQPCLLYKANDDYGIVSSNAAIPSVFTVSGSNPAITLVPTTYTLETVVPEYLKYVAVVKAYKSDDTSKTNDMSVVNDANSAENMNTVLPGSYHRVHMAPLKLKKGYTYQIVYQGMDYSGVICGRTYYVKVQ